MGDWSDSPGSFFSNLGSSIKDGYNSIFSSNKTGKDPYQDQWGALLDQLRTQSLGQGPSMAGMAYNRAANNGMAMQTALSRGRSAGAARAGALGLARTQQGMAEGYASARTGEMQGYQQQYAAALQAADQAQFQRDNADANKPSTFQNAMGFAGQVATLGGMLKGGGTPSAPAPAPAGAPPAPNVYSTPYSGSPSSGSGVDYDSYFKNKGY